MRDPQSLRLLRQRSESLDAFVIRDAQADEIPALAALHVAAWNQTYPNVKEPPTVAIREHQWREQFAVGDGSWFVLVVVNPKGDLVGFARGLPYSHSDLPEYAGELNKLYLLRDYQRLGMGRRLVGHVARRFLSQGITSMVLFGVAENPSCRFHDALEGQRLYAKNGEFHGGYGWRDLRRLAEICP